MILKRPQESGVTMCTLTGSRPFLTLRWLGELGIVPPQLLNVLLLYAKPMGGVDRLGSSPPLYDMGILS